MRRYKTNYSNRKSNSNDKSFYRNKTGVTTPDLPKTPVTSSIFPDAVKNSSTSTSKFTTPWQQYRSFDAELNKIDVNISGYAALYGSPTQISNINLGNDYGLFTGSFNDIYNDDQFSMLATIMRDISINYWGMDFTKLADETSGINKLNDHAFSTWESNMTTVLSMLDQSMYTDLRFLQWTYQTTGPTSNYKYALSTQSYMLLAYQLQLITVLITVLNFEMLTAQLPLLQELFKDKTMFIVAIQDELKRSRYTARVKRLITWLKARFIDTNFFKNFILPTAVVSKETDGLNSPIVYLRQSVNIPLEPIYYHNPNTGQADRDSYTLPVKFFTQGIQVTHATDTNEITNITGADSNMLTVILDAFNVNTILDILMESDDKAAFALRLKAWLNTAEAVLDSLLSQALDASSQRWFRDTEAAIQKLASQPSGITWQQNVDPSAIFITKYSNYELVNTLATFMPAPVTYNNNGYSMYLPLFRRTGFRETMIKEHAQAFYLPSNSKSMSFIKLGSSIFFTTRQNKRLVGDVVSDPNYSTETSVLNVQKVVLSFDTKGNPTYNRENVSLLDFNQQMYLLLQDYFTVVRDTGTTPVTWVNSELITFVNAIFQNRWADYQKLATQNFIVPLA